MEDFFVSANLLDIGFSGELVIGGGVCHISLYLTWRMVDFRRIYIYLHQATLYSIWSKNCK